MTCRIGYAFEYTFRLINNSINTYLQSFNRKSEFVGKGCNYTAKIC
jgi:hypothetical protein